jgi:hypothetical protein
MRRCDGRKCSAVRLSCRLGTFKTWLVSEPEEASLGASLPHYIAVERAFRVIFTNADKPLSDEHSWRCLFFYRARTPFASHRARFARGLAGRRDNVFQPQGLAFSREEALPTRPQIGLARFREGEPPCEPAPGRGSDGASPSRNHAR